MVRLELPGMFVAYMDGVLLPREFDGIYVGWSACHAAPLDK
jgi:hypothetical protein